MRNRDSAPHAPDLTPVFAYSIAADQHRPSEGDGFIRAETIQQAVALVGHPEVNVYALPPSRLSGVLARLRNESFRSLKLSCGMKIDRYDCSSAD